MVDRRRVGAWSAYSWANHGWETTVATVLIGPWLLSLATQHRPGSATLFHLAGIPLKAASFPSFAITVAALGQLLVLPWLGAAADRRASRGRWLLAACLLGGLFAGGLALTSGGAFVPAAVLFVLGSIAYGGSNLLYNSYLPEIADAVDRHAVSSSGFFFGYLGGGLLLAADLALLVGHRTIGLGEATAARLCFASAALWWVGFGVVALRRLGAPRSVGVGSPSARETWRALLAAPQTRRYLIAYLLFSDAISAVLALASTFITHELYDDDATKASTFLFSLILLIQFVAMAGAAIWARVAARFGAARTLLMTLLVWSVVIVATYALLRTKAEAVAIGVVLGSVLGGSQALARSIWSQLIPPGREAAYFGIFEVANEGTAWLAPLLFTVVVNVTGSYRQAILSLLVLFCAGGLLLARTDVEAAAREQVV